MFSSIVGGLAALAEGFAAWLRARQQAKDQSDGAAIQAGVNSAETIKDASDVSKQDAAASAGGTAAIRKRLLDESRP